MERLTERELYDGKVCFTKCAHTNCPDKCAFCYIPDEANARLKEYEDMEEQGRIVKLPCAVGSIVYEPRPDRGFISTYEVTMITITSTIRFKWMLLDGIYSNLDGFSIDDIGKTVFLTGEQAEQAMKQEQS